jgi:hypothetical protein
MGELMSDDKPDKKKDIEEIEDQAIDQSALDKNDSSTKNVTASVDEYQDISKEPTENIAFTQKEANRFKSLKDKARRLSKNRYFRIAAPLLVVLVVALFAFVPVLKYGFLNLFSSTSASILVVDDETLAPIKDATVKLDGKTAETNEKGLASLKGINYGVAKYSVSKEAYSTLTLKGKITGNTTLGPVKLHSTGVAVNFKATNTLSHQSILDFTVSIANTNISAQSNKAGIATLKVPAYKLGKLTFDASGGSYNDAQLTSVISANEPAAPIGVALTPAGKHYFLSNQSGKIDVYSANLDGTDPAVIIPGTGSEDNSTTLTVSPDGTHAALVSKRDKETAADGTVENALYLVDFSKKTIKRLDSGAIDMSVVGWSDNSHIIYSVDDGAYNQPDSAKLKLVNIDSGQISTLYSAQYSNGYFFYNEDPSHVYFMENDDTVADYGINSINVTTQKTQRIYDTPPDNDQLVHFQPNRSSFEINNQWYTLNLSSQQVAAGTQPSVQGEGDYYTPSPDGTEYAWTETRDGQSSLIVGNGQSLSNARLVIRNPVVTTILDWSNPNYITYNSVTPDDTADYIVYMPTGVVTKISDVFTPSYNQ